MKKIIFRSFLTLFIILIFVIIFLVTYGLNTNKFNSKIAEEIKKVDKNLNIELKELKIRLDLSSFELKAKTLGTKLSYKDRVIKLENIKTTIPIGALIKNDFSLSNLEISTKSIQINEVVSFVRSINKTPELYILEKIIKKGYLIADIKVEFDRNGKIKDNYEINGFIKDAKLNLLSNNSLNKINFIFEVKNKVLKLNDINLFLNKTNLSFKKLILVNKNEKYFVEGESNNDNLILEKDEIKKFIEYDLNNFDIKKLNFNANNKFSFFINKKLKINDLKFQSSLKLNELIIENKFNLINFFPEINNEIIFTDHNLNLVYEKKDLTINGNGKIILQSNHDEIDYLIKYKNKKFIFDFSLFIEDNIIDMKKINYKKKRNSKAILKIKGNQLNKGKLFLEILELSEENNIFKIDNLNLDNNLRIIRFDKAFFDFKDNDKQINFFTINRKDNLYFLKGTKLNANKLIEDITNIGTDNKFEVFKEDFKLNIDLKEVRLDELHKVKNLRGKLNFRNNDLIDGNLNALFNDGKKFSFTVKTNFNEQITTLFLDKAEPIIKRYKFVKGFNEGSLDFSSSQIDNKSIATLKIYDFKLKELPVLTKILTIASLQGIADLLSGEGIRFDELEMKYTNDKNLITINEIYAIGPAISILMDGYIEKNKLVSLRGTIVPATTINKVISSIPLIGDVLVGSKVGEGVFGVSFKIKGPPQKLETTVNPIKTLTPRFITRTLEKIKKN